MQKIVIDTNVLRSALTSRNGASFKLLSLLAEDRFIVSISTTLVLEYEAVLKLEVANFDHQYIDDILDYICSVGEKEEVFFLWRPLLKDPNDDFLLELAVKAGADIVTYNVKDFMQASKFGIRVLTPKEFLGEIEK
jgi:putative PIN family toxin of toxin-antitoxin system